MRAAAARPIHRAMNRGARNVLYVKLIFVVIFAVLVAGVWWYQLAIGRPRMRCLRTPGGEWSAKTRTCHVPPSFACERGGGWWDAKDGLCAKVVNIPDITGRK